MVAHLPHRSSRNLFDFVSQHLSTGYSRLRFDLEDGDSLPFSEKQSSSIRSRLSQLGWYLLPSFVSRRFGHSDVVVLKPNATSYLNGLRGLAATMVVLQHMTTDFYWFIHWAYGAREEDRHIIQLPFVRVLISGRFMVGIFFIISGFVLSYSPLKKAHAGGSATVGLPAAVFRRPIRLFLPVLPIALVTPVFIWMQVFYKDGGSNLQPAHDTLLAEVGEGWHQWRTMAWMPFDWGDYLPPYFPQCWTLNAEFRGSIIVFIATLVLSGVAPWIRMLLVSMVAWDAMHNASNRWSVFCFLCGFLLADLRHLRAKLPEWPAPVRWAAKAGSCGLFIAGLFFGGWPIEGASDGLWYSSFASLPTYGNSPQYYWFSIASVMVVVALESLPVLQNVLNSPFLLYMGEISFGLYLVHWSVLFTVGKGLIFGLRVRGVDDLTAFAVGNAIAVVLCVWAGDIHWRLVDKNCVKLSRWAAEKLGI